MIKDIIKDLEKLNDLEDYKGDWINLYFLHSGRTFKGSLKHNSEELARIGAQRYINLCKDKMGYMLNPAVIRQIGKRRCSELSHAIQLPLG